jgi:3'(2'), 5'-bisphosphate nucleotidase
MIAKVIEIAHQASFEVLKIYNKGIIQIQSKQDNSPVTEADLISNKIIINGLRNISNYPILTEESPVEYKVRKNWTKYWVVDPLDGTKDFIAKNGGFTINIALIEKTKPIMGVVLVPVTGEVYYAELGRGSYKNNKKIFNNSKRIDLIGADSIHHSTKEVELFFKKHNISKVLKLGSSIKICKLAEGEVDVYPRLNGTKEWDTAASHIIANEAGCRLIDTESKKELTYNKKSLKNNHFIAIRNNLDLKNDFY